MKGRRGLFGVADFATDGNCSVVAMPVEGDEAGVGMGGGEGATAISDFMGMRTAVVRSGIEATSVGVLKMRAGCGCTTPPIGMALAGTLLTNSCGILLILYN